MASKLMRRREFEMKEYLDVTRREFMRAAALVSASAVTGLPGIETSTAALAQEPQQSKEVAMGSVRCV